jgi:formylmethanofuran dehydrogenase subunit A
MCIICAAIPATAAVGAKLNAGQLQKPEEQRKPIAKITGIVIALLMITSAVYHTLIWRS